MQITNKFTIAVHTVVATAYFQNDYTVTSAFLTGSVGANPVVVRTVVSDLKRAEILDVSQGKTGIRIKKPLEKVTFYDVYKAIGGENEDGLFRFHDDPNENCPVGKNIHAALDGKLTQVERAMTEEMKRITINDVFTDVVKIIQRQ